MSNPCDIANCLNDATVSLSVTTDERGCKCRFLCEPHANEEIAVLDNYGVGYRDEPIRPIFARATARDRLALGWNRGRDDCRVELAARRA